MFRSKVLLNKQTLFRKSFLTYTTNQPRHIIYEFLSITASCIGIWFAYRFYFSKSKMPTMTPMEVDYKIEPDSKVSRFNEVCGISEVKAELLDLVDMIKNKEKYVRLGAKLPKGILLTGQPGTGKTLMARAVAGEAEATIFTASGAEFDEVFVGVGASRIRELFKEAKKHSPAIVFIDEIDTIGCSRIEESYVDRRSETLNQLLVEMDGFEEHDNIIVIGATNMAHDMDPALLRPGRFDKQIAVPVPNRSDRMEIFKHYLSSVISDPQIDIEAVAMATTGFTGADISNMVNTALLLAVKDGRHACTQSDLFLARDRIFLGIASPSLCRSENRKLKIALREASKALAIMNFDKTRKLDKVSILKRGSFQGKTSSVALDDNISVTKEAIYNTVKVAMASQAAEEAFFHKGKISDYNSNGMKEAGEYLRNNIMQGLLDEFGLVFYEKFDHLSGKNQDLLHSIVKREVDKCYKETLEYLRSKERVIRKVAQELVKKETLRVEEVEEIVKSG